MCRLYGFRSQIPSRAHTSLVVAENALSRQSVKHPDGWGVAYYIGRYPHLIRSDKQALADGIFKELSGVVATRTLVAHIRQATVGQVGILNCHPFQHGPWIFAHNGEVTGYGAHQAVRDAVAQATSPTLRHHALGTTDSEAAFYVFLTQLQARAHDLNDEALPLETTLAALAETVRVLVDAASRVPGEPARLSLLITNGSLLIGYRHRRDLFFSTYKSRCPERDTCAAFSPARCEAPVTEGAVNHLLVASERLAENPNVWNELQDGEYVAVDGAMRFVRGVL